MAATKKIVEPENSAASPSVIDATEILAELKRLTERIESQETENKRLQAALQQAQQSGQFVDEFGNVVNCLPPNSDKSLIADKPGTLLEKLDIMEVLAAQRREPFDRERTRKVLMGEPVEELVEFICQHCGRGEEKWNGHEELFNAHLEWHTKGGKARAYQNQRKVRAVDEAAVVAE